MMLNMGVTVESAMRSFQVGEGGLKALREIYSVRVQSAAQKVVDSYE